MDLERKYLCDVENWIFKGCPLWLQERFHAIWAAVAFSHKVPPNTRSKFMVRMMKEGENGFWINTCSGERMFVVVNFALYSADMAEFTQANGTIQKGGRAKRWCYRCECQNSDLCDPNYPIKENAVSPEKRLSLYQEANLHSKTVGAKRVE